MVMICGHFISKWLMAMKVTGDTAIPYSTKLAVVRECAVLHRPVQTVADAYAVSVASAYRWKNDAALTGRALEKTTIGLLRIELMAAEAVLQWMGWGGHLFREPRGNRFRDPKDQKRDIVERLRVARVMAKAQGNWLNPDSSIAGETKYAFIRERMSDVPVSVACKAFGVARSGYYAWLRRTSESRHSAGEKMKPLIARAAIEIGGPASYRRISEHLRSEGVICSRHRVKKLMGRPLPAR